MANCQTKNTGFLMSNIIDANGVQIKELQDIIADIKQGFRDVYGNEINLDPETPDAQMITIFSKAARDIEEFILYVNSMFDPDQAEGRILDQRLAINGIQRQAGSHSITPVDITVDRAIQLFGMDHTGQEQKYIVEDDAGTRWVLRNTVSLIAGTHTLSFQAVEPGSTLSQVGTIRTPVTIINGVTDVNNSLPQTTIGDDEESDFAVKERRRQSVSLSSQGYRPALLAALKNISGMIDAYVYENRSSITDSRGVPPHGVWVVTDGTASNQDIADAIYKKRNAGANLKEGSKFYDVLEVDGEVFRATWDEVAVASFFAKFTLIPLNPAIPVATNVIIQRLPSVFRPGVGGKININDLAIAIKSIDPNALVVDSGFSLTANGVFTPVLTPEANERFGLTQSTIIALPIEILPRVTNVQANTNLQLSAIGGLAPYTWEVDGGPGTIDSNGVFNSPVSGTSYIKVTDALNNEGFKTIQVVS